MTPDLAALAKACEEIEWIAARLDDRARAERLMQAIVTVLDFSAANAAEIERLTKALEPLVDILDAAERANGGELPGDYQLSIQVALIRRAQATEVK